MSKSNQSVVSLPAVSLNPLEDILKQGARRMLQTAIESEVEAYVASYLGETDENGHRMVVRNGWHPKRSIQTGLGDIEIQRPKVNDKRTDELGHRCKFESKILPAYLRRTKNIEELIPWLYLRGISSGDFSQALTSLLGEGAPGLSATTVTRLKSSWENEYNEWTKRSFEGRQFVYIWVDGIFTKIRLGEDKKSCMLVVIGVAEDGMKELLAIEAGERESKISWKGVLVDIKRRGLEISPKLAIGDGALGFWGALDEVYPITKRQRCWVHKTANVLDKLPKSKQPSAKKALHNIYNSSSKHEANEMFETFLEIYGDKYPRATKCLLKDKEDMLSFYDFPAAHWAHIRTTNPIESTFATIRLRTKRTKGSGSPMAALTMVFKLAQCAEKTWRKIRKPELLKDVLNDEIVFVDGEKTKAA